jgi:hypothetical protein
LKSGRATLVRVVAAGFEQGLFRRVLLKPQSYAQELFQ